LNYLLDTNIISAIAPTQRKRSAALVDWFDQASNGLYLSVVTAAEIRAGIAKSRREGASRKAAQLNDWWDAVEHLYGSRILSFDLRSAKIAGRLIDAAKGRGYAPRFADIAIAATAEAHGLLILTRNKRHFDAISASALDPFDGLPQLPSAPKNE
jgi:predicted nucleic acid-binding protein